MLDVALLALVVFLTVVTIAYGAACDVLMRTDTTRESGLDR